MKLSPPQINALVSIYAGQFEITILGRYQTKDGSRIHTNTVNSLIDRGLMQRYGSVTTEEGETLPYITLTIGGHHLVRSWMLAQEQIDRHTRVLLAA